ncbi:Phosphoglycerate mutase family protein [Caenispirillum salinarum AK4]|uniref:Phosphoglycerate mutase family protein n=1 Tax=Caenispirillum salinarum AK4 TaxID=1238182 RepID=K9HPC2_9PROT|nr:histidine phosphatase family protein [Caenispirillum salinarum]EKV30341.1 Phosphoglycerate mutase family protein [Caenispirillum salinarum AK4]
MRLTQALLTLLLLPLFTVPALAAEDALWSALKEGGHVVLVRHALAPGTGDPSNFALDDCSTQRNLNDTGRRQARDTGDAFRAHDVPVSRVLTSQWCRCVETAELLDLAPVEEEPLLNSFFRDRSRGPAQIAGLEDLIAGLPRDGGTVVMVTHQVVITGLTDVFPASGEMVVLRLDPGGGWTQAGRMAAR